METKTKAQLSDISIHPEISCPRNCQGCYWKQQPPKGEKISPRWVWDLVRLSPVKVTIHLNSAEYFSNLYLARPGSLKEKPTIIMEASEFSRSKYSRSSDLSDVFDIYVSIHDSDGLAAIVSSSAKSKVCGLNILSGELPENLLRNVVEAFKMLPIYLILPKGENSSVKNHSQYVLDSKVVYKSLSPQMDSCLLDLMDGKEECLGNSTLDIRPGIVVKSCPYSSKELLELGQVRPEDILIRIPELLELAKDFCPSKCSLISGEEIVRAKSKKTNEKESDNESVHARGNQVTLHDRWNTDRL